MVLARVGLLQRHNQGGMSLVRCAVSTHQKVDPASDVGPHPFSPSEFTGGWGVSCTGRYSIPGLAPQMGTRNGAGRVVNLLPRVNDPRSIDSENTSGLEASAKAGELHAAHDEEKRS